MEAAGVSAPRRGRPVGDEAAVVLGITPGNVRFELDRARRRIADRVREKLAGVRKAKEPESGKRSGGRGTET